MSSKYCFLSLIKQKGHIFLIYKNVNMYTILKNAHKKVKDKIYFQR
jgi:hypothetical protein